MEPGGEALYVFQRGSGKREVRLNELFVIKFQIRDGYDSIN